MNKHEKKLLKIEGMSAEEGVAELNRDKSQFFDLVQSRVWSFIKNS